MGVRVVDETSVLQEASNLVRSAERTLDVASPWIRGGSSRRLLAGRGPGVATRILFRIREPEDLEITDLGALLASARQGAEVRYSGRLHAKVIIADGTRALVTSSNLTEAAGFGFQDADRRNREVGLVVEDEPEALAGIVERFAAAWEEGRWLDDGVVGVVMDFPTDRGFHVACLSTPVPGTYVAAADAAGDLVVGRVTAITGYNRTFPRMTAGMWATQGYGAAPDAGARSYEYADLQSLFSVPEKERGVLGVVASVDASSLFHVAAVETLACVEGGRSSPRRLPVPPGTLARRAGPAELRPLLGTGEIGVGCVWHHADVEVRARGPEILTRHLAVLGMTGSGKSNALLVVTDALRRAYPDLRIVLVDSHGEYGALVGARVVVPTLRVDLLSEGAAKLLLRLPREDAALAARIRQAADCAPDLQGFALSLEALAEGENAGWANSARRLSRLCRQEPERLCLGGPEAHFDGEWGPGINVLDVSGIEGLEARAKVVGAALDEVYSRGLRDPGWLVALDEAQNYVPEQQTGLLARTRPSFEAAFRIASEGRKFGIGLVLASQRPARVNKDVLSQCNSHMVFRLANVEDLQAVAGSFETAGRKLLDDLPGLPVGVCLAGGTAFGMPVRVQVPLFGRQGDGAPEGSPAEGAPGERLRRG